MEQETQKKSNKLFKSLLRIIGAFLVAISFLIIPIIIISGFLIPFIASFLGVFIIYYFVLTISGGLSLFLVGLSLISFGELENVKKSHFTANLLGIIQLILGGLIFLISITTMYLLFIKMGLKINNILLPLVLVNLLSLSNIFFGYHLKNKYGILRSSEAPIINN